MIRLLSLILSALIALSPLTANAAGEVVIVTAPWTVAVGDPVIVGGFAGIAAQGVSSGASLRLRREGVFTVAKTTGTAWSVGDALYYAHGDAGLSKTSASKTFFGFAASSASSGAAVGSLVLVPSPSFASIESAISTLTSTLAGYATTFTTGSLVCDSLEVNGVDYDTTITGLDGRITTLESGGGDLVCTSITASTATFDTIGEKTAGGAHVTVDGVDVYALGTSVTSQDSRLTDAESRIVNELFGDGSDGDYTCSSSTATSGPLTSGALTRPAYWHNFTPVAGCQVNATGEPFYVSGTLDLANAPANWLVTTTPTAGTAGTGTGGVAAATVSLAQSDVPLQTVGTAGAASGQPGAQASGPAAAIWLGYPGGTGGAGGTSSSGTGSYAGGAARAPLVHTTRRWLAPWRPLSLIAGSSVRPCSSGAGGGGGGGNGGGSGGGAGLCGYSIILHARSLVTGVSTPAAMFRATGGAGGNGGVFGVGGGGGGGAGGGGGGLIEIAYWTRTGASVSDAFSTVGGTGGTGGAGNGGGTAGSNGTGGHGGLVAICNAKTSACVNYLDTTPASGTSGGYTTAPL